jgi:hypothetical protein
MPLPEPRPVLVQVPARAGIGLRAQILRGIRTRLPWPSWPADWWQRNYDAVYEVDAPDPIPLTERQMRIPPPPTP